MIYTESLVTMDQNELENTNGGSTKIAAGICGIVSGVLCIGAGVSSLFGWNKASAWFTIGSGGCATAAGILALIPSP